MQALSSHRLSDIRIIIICLLQFRSALTRELQPLTGMIWTVPASCLHWIEVQPKGFASKESACECSLFDGILIHLKGAYLTAFPESNLHEVVFLSEGFSIFFWHRFSGILLTATTGTYLSAMSGILLAIYSHSRCGATFTLN